MPENFESISNALNTETDIVEVESVPIEIQKVNQERNDLKKDYEYSRGQLYSLIE